MTCLPGMSAAETRCRTCFFMSSPQRGKANATQQPLQHQLVSGALWVSHAATHLPRDLTHVTHHHSHQWCLTSTECGIATWGAEQWAGEKKKQLSDGIYLRPMPIVPINRNCTLSKSTADIVTLTSYHLLKLGDAIMLCHCKIEIVLHMR